MRQQWQEVGGPCFLWQSQHGGQVYMKMLRGLGHIEAGVFCSDVRQTLDTAGWVIVDGFSVVYRGRIYI